MSRSAARRWSASASSPRRSTTAARCASSASVTARCASTTAAAAADAADSTPRSASRAAASAATAVRSSSALPATSAFIASCWAVRRSCSPPRASLRLSQTRRGRQRALALHGEAVEGGAALAHRCSRRLERGGHPRVLGLGGLQLGGQARLFLRPRVVVALLRPARQLGDQPLALGRGRALDLVEQVQPLLGEPAHALEPSVQHACAQQAPRVALALGELPGEGLLLARTGGGDLGEPVLVPGARRVDLGELVATRLQLRRPARRPLR